MKSWKITIGAIALIAIVSIAAFNFNVLFTSAPPDSMKNIKIDLKGAAYTDDHAMVEFSVNGEILTPDGPLTECPVGGVKLLNTTGEEMAVSDQDFVFCRPDKNGGYLITQIMYGDFSSENKKPKKVKIKIGDVNFTANDGQIAKVNVIGYKEFNLPKMKDMDSVSYPSSTAEAASGLKMKIKRVDYSPSLAKIDACLTLPNSGDWLFDDAYLLVGDQKVPFEYWTIPNYDKPGILENQERCYSVIVTDIPDYKTFRKGDVSFVIEKISRNSLPECVDATDWAKIKDEMAKYDVPFSSDADGTHYCSSLRGLSSDTSMHIINYIQDALKEEIVGPLVIPLK